MSPERCTRERTFVESELVRPLRCADVVQYRGWQNLPSPEKPIPEHVHLGLCQLEVVGSRLRAPGRNVVEGCTGSEALSSLRLTVDDQGTFVPRTEVDTVHHVGAIVRCQTARL